MSVRLTGGTERAFAALLRQANSTKQFLIQQRTRMVAPTCEANVPLGIIEHCAIVLALFDGWAATPGLLQYVRDQYADAAYDIVAEYQTTRAALVALRNGLRAGFPEDANGWLLYRRLDANGRLVTRTFTAAQLVDSVPLMDAVINSIT